MNNEHTTNSMEVHYYDGDFEPEDAFQEDPIDLDGEANCSMQMLKQVEQQFIAYFLKKIGPSRKTEEIRQSVYSTLTEILDSKYGKSAN